MKWEITSGGDTEEGKVCLPFHGPKRVSVVK